MKSILTPTGGRPIKNEDIELFEQFVTMFESIFENIPSLTDFIISGCEISGSDVSAGYIYYDGKICTFEGASGVSFPLSMERTSTDGTPRTFFDGVVKNTIHTESISAQVGGGFSLSASTPRLEDFFVKAATLSENLTGTDSYKAATPEGLYTWNDGVKKLEQDIGIWNMDASATKTFLLSTFGITYNQIRNVSVVIKADASEGIFYSLANRVISATWNSTTLTLTRDTGNWESYDSSSENRGTILIEYK